MGGDRIRPGRDSEDRGGGGIIKCVQYEVDKAADRALAGGNKRHCEDNPPAKKNSGQPAFSCAPASVRCAWLAPGLLGMILWWRPLGVASEKGVAPLCGCLITPKCSSCGARLLWNGTQLYGSVDVKTSKHYCSTGVMGCASSVRYKRDWTAD